MGLVDAAYFCMLGINMGLIDFGIDFTLGVKDIELYIIYGQDWRFTTYEVSLYSRVTFCYIYGTSFSC